jgi:hypothetical protein
MIVLQIIKDKMKRKRKRAPGGGRKASGPFTQNSSQLTVRIRDDLRRKLETAAKEEGHSLSQELQARLKWSFYQDRNNRDPATNALSFLISEVAHRVHLRMPVPWSHDPLLFTSFRLAVTQLLEKLQPPGEIKNPLSKLPSEAAAMLEPVDLQQLKDRWEDANDLATRVVNDIFDSLRLAEGDIAARLSGIFGDDKHLIKQFEREFYSMSHVKRDLGIQFVKPRETKP